MSKIRIPSSELQIGDVVDKGNYAYRVQQIIEVTDKMIHVGGRYTTCKFEPERIGENWLMSSRKSTMLNVERG